MTRSQAIVRITTFALFVLSRLGDGFANAKTKVVAQRSRWLQLLAGGLGVGRSIRLNGDDYLGHGGGERRRRDQDL
jgi:hypothetical protein